MIETEEELRSAHSAGLLWYKLEGRDEYAREFVNSADSLVEEWKARRVGNLRWDAYVLVEDE